MELLFTLAKNSPLGQCGVTIIHTFLVTLLCIAFFGNIGMLVFAYKRTGKAGSICFAMLVGALLFDILGYMLELLATTPGELMIGLRLENLGIPFLAPFFMLTMLDFFYPNAPLRRMIIASLIYGGCMGMLIFFNDHHFLYYTSVEMVNNGFFDVAKLGKGPLYYAQQGVTMLCMLSAYILLLIRFVRGSAKLRRQMALLIYGSLFPFIANLANVLDIAPLGLDFTPLALSMGLVFFAVNLSRHKLIDITPAAFDMAIEKLDDAVVVVDNDWGYVYCNPQARVLFPVLARFSGTEDIVHAEGWPATLHPAAGKEVAFSHLSESGAETLQKAKVDPILNKRGKTIGHSITIHDVTEIMALLERLEELAITDSLTGAFNRRHFTTYAEAQMDLARRHDLRIGLLLLDIDYFKAVNDTYGHMAGDQVLCSVVQAISEKLRPQDMLARYGGEEFVVLTFEKSEESLMCFANLLKDAIEALSLTVEGKQISITASFGAVIIPPGASYGDAMAAVDKALYAAKANGRNRVEFASVQ